MKGDRLTRINTLLQHELAEAIFRVINEPGFEPSAVTVTRVETSSNLRNARVHVSIRAEAHAQRAMLRLLMHHRGDLQAIIGRNVTMKYTPHLTIILDDSLEEGDRILHLIEDIEQAHPEWTGEEDHVEG